MSAAALSIHRRLLSPPRRRGAGAPLRLGLTTLLALATTLAARGALACAACGCGDPTLTAMGTEKPLDRRLRLAVEGRHRSDVIGEPRVDEVRLREQRSDLQLAWAPHERVFLLAALPLLHRDVAYADLSTATQTGVGDLDLRAKVFLYQDQSFAARHLVAAIVGLKAPTGAAARQHDGALVPTELQLGTGSFDPSVGLSYGHFAPPWSFYTSALVTLPTVGRDDTRASRSLRTTVAGQRQWTNLALRASVDTRLDGTARERGQREPDSGGFIAFAGPEVLLAPFTDLVVSLGAKAPVWNALWGRHREGLIVTVGVVYDL